MRDIYWLERAAEDLYRIVTRLEESNLDYAQRVYQAIQTTAGNLASFPNFGRPGRVKGTREVVVPKHPYILPYRDVEEENRIEILAAMHASQEWPTSFRRKRQR